MKFFIDTANLDQIREFISKYIQILSQTQPLKILKTPFGHSGIRPYHSDKSK